LDSTTFSAAITVAGGIVAASVTFLLTKRHQLQVEWRHEKLNHYKVLLSALSDLAVDGTDKNKANMNFALAVNTIGLVAPQYVIKVLMDFHDEVKFFNPNKTPGRHDELLNLLIIAIRKDLKLAKKDNPSTFKFHLIGSKPAN
jgi:hypothetical protein